MKVQSLKSLETYIYSQVILPLKNLQVPNINLDSPLRNRSGEPLQLNVSRMEIDYSQYRRDYQRRIARQKQPFIVTIDSLINRRKIAEYNPKGHSVIIFRDAMRDVTNSGILLGKLEEAFKTNTPFTKVVATNEPV